MGSFLLGFLGGAVASAGYVLLRTPRSGQENQKFVKDYIDTTKVNVENVQDKASNVQASVNNLNAEVAKLQVGFIPEVTKIAEEFQAEVDLHSRRINHEIEQINREVEVMTNRINVKNEKVQIDQSSDNN